MFEAIDTNNDGIITVEEYQTALKKPVHMPHMPKVACGHGLFVSSAVTEAPTLKPGQGELHRKGVYSFEAKRALAGTSSLALALRGEQGAQAKSEYLRMHHVSPDHYVCSKKTTRHEEAIDTNHDGKISVEECQNALKKPVQTTDVDCSAAGTTRNWKSEYQAKGEEAGGAPLEHRGAAKGVTRRNYNYSYQPPQSIGRKDTSTSSGHHFGRYGSNPRDRVDHKVATLQVHPNSLNRGTTRGTSHIPGYQGFIAANPLGPHSARAALGEATRSVDKTNLGDIFRTNLVGYTGHVPESHNNDFGGRKPTDLTTSGRDYAPLRSARF